MSDHLVSSFEPFPTWATRTAFYSAEVKAILRVDICVRAVAISKCDSHNSSVEYEPTPICIASEKGGPYSPGGSICMSLSQPRH